MAPSRLSEQKVSELTLLPAPKTKTLRWPTHSSEHAAVVTCNVKAFVPAGRPASFAGKRWAGALPGDGVGVVTSPVFGCQCHAWRGEVRARAAACRES
jgi:hypothetical protein